jgi:hypothetical protein
VGFDAVFLKIYLSGGAYFIYQDIKAPSKLMVEALYFS